MTTDFNMPLQAMMDGEFTNLLFKQINSNAPGGLKTSRMARGDSRTLNLTMFNLSEIFMRTPAFESPEAVLNLEENRVSATLGSLLGQLESIPGFSNLIPEDIRIRAGLMGVDEPHDDAAAEDGRDASEMDGISTLDNPTANKVVSLARNEIGTTESPSGSNRQKYAGIAGVQNGLAWCATFCMAMLIKGGLPQTGLLNPSTEDSIRRYRNAGQAGKTPRVGALAFFNFRANQGRYVSHVGLVAGWDEGNIITIDGNTSSGNGGSQDNGGIVAEKRRPLNSVVEYGYPKYPERTTSGGQSNFEVT